MRQICLHARAEIDLVDIWAYTYHEWNDLQADTYLDELHAAIRSLAENPQRGISRNPVRDGYRALFVNRHVIYYRLTPTIVAVVRVLHGQMDPDRHL